MNLDYCYKFIKLITSKILNQLHKYLRLRNYLKIMYK